mgnify:FL=1
MNLSTYELEVCELFCSFVVEFLKPQSMNLFDLNLTLPISDPTWVFFLVLIIILFAPMILGRLHIPHIIGMILAGVLI